uniref:ABC transporter subunit C n=1 Tax=Andalucia godoyi TaxID=505711 RepID=M4Q9B2_ANDGO|nr:ABC transporter subunit C [Andalucia godoyi]AGH24007.1 ABC transporter subunit C [Andalucia godoyi]
MSYWFYTKPSYFLRSTQWIHSLFLFLGILFLTIGLFLGLFSMNSDAQQGENARILYLHVPSAWMSLFLYSFMALLSLLYLIWYHPMAFLMAKLTAWIGTLFTFLTLVTGSLWGFPVWGTFWVWDARLTSVFVLFLFYLGYLVLVSSLPNPKIPSILAIVGFLNIPIIKFSVEWWNTLHQTSSVSAMQSSIHFSMLFPLLFVFFGFLCFAMYVYFLLLRREILIKKLRLPEIRD